MAAEAPPLAFGTDEIGQVGRAFNLVQETAVQVAVEQAALRRGIRDVFLSLARRSQALVHRQLTLLDTMERRETSPEELEDLFRVDHLATRMRRNAEDLIVLSGAVPGRGWRNPVPLVDVVRGAVAEVEEYERVTVAQIGSASLAGRAVGDIIHLLAELMENAPSFSPPHTMVQVSGQLVGNGFAVEIEDRGLGMSEADLDAANAQLANPPEFNLSSTARLGLYVVGRLAERHQSGSGCVPRRTAASPRSCSSRPAWWSTRSRRTPCRPPSATASPPPGPPSWPGSRWRAPPDCARPTAPATPPPPSAPAAGNVAFPGSGTRRRHVR